MSAHTKALKDRPRVKETSSKPLDLTNSGGSVFSLSLFASFVLVRRRRSIIVTPRSLLLSPPPWSVERRRMRENQGRSNVKPLPFIYPIPPSFPNTLSFISSLHSTPSSCVLSYVHSVCVHFPFSPSITLSFCPLRPTCWPPHSLTKPHTYFSCKNLFNCQHVVQHSFPTCPPFRGTRSARVLLRSGCRAGSQTLLQCSLSPSPKIVPRRTQARPARCLDAAAPDRGQGFLVVDGKFHQVGKCYKLCLFALSSSRRDQGTPSRSQVLHRQCHQRPIDVLG